MIQIKTVTITDEDAVSLSLDYRNNENCIIIQMEDGYEFSVPIAEWNDFVQKIQSIKELITPPQTTETDESKNQ
jgi:hypothetical protein